MLVINPVAHLSALAIADAVTGTNLVTEHPWAQIFHALLQLLIWHISQTFQRVIRPSAPHITHEAVIVLLATRDIHCRLGRAGLHDHTAEESLVVALVSDNLTANAHTPRALAPSGSAVN